MNDSSISHLGITMDGIDSEISMGKIYLSKIGPGI